MPALIRTRRRHLALLLWPLVASACGGSTTGPSATDPRVTAVSPATGATTGGTTVIVAGANFTSDATISFGGQLAAQVTFVDSTSIQAMTPQHAAGAVDVVVTVKNRQATLPKGYTYVAPPPVVNAPPVISAVSVRGFGPTEPAQYATLGEAVRAVATVADAETPLSQLTVVWSADAGTFASASGTSVIWNAPQQFATPGTATLTITVTERYQSTDNSGLPVVLEHQVRATTPARVHDSIREVNDLAIQFLSDFSKQLDPAFVVRNFTDSCRGKIDEFNDVVKSNQGFTINSYSIGTPVTTVAFTGSCPFRGVRGDACAQVPVYWNSTMKATGQQVIAEGIDQVTAIYEGSQWRLCASDFDPKFSTSGIRFKD